MAQSSVEWLADNLDKYISPGNEIKTVYALIMQAKAMHKQEHEDAYIEGSKCRYDGWAWTLEGIKEMANIHYNDIYGNDTP